MKHELDNAMTWMRGCVVLLLSLMFAASGWAQTKSIRIVKPTQPAQVICLDDTSDITLQDDDEILSAVAFSDDLSDCGQGSPVDVLFFGVTSDTDSDPGDQGDEQASPGDFLDFSTLVNVPSDATSPVCFIEGDQTVVDETLPFELQPQLVANGSNQLRDATLTVAAAAPNGIRSFNIRCEPGIPSDAEAEDTIEIINGSDVSEVIINTFTVDNDSPTQGASVLFTFNLDVPTDIASDAQCQISAPNGVFTTNPVVIDPVADGSNQQSVNISGISPLGPQLITLSCTPGAMTDTALIDVQDDDPPIQCPELPPEAVRDTPFQFTSVFPNGWGSGLVGANTVLTFDADKYLALEFNSAQAPNGVIESLFDWAEAPGGFTISGVSFSISRCEGQFEAMTGDDIDCFTQNATIDSSMAWIFDTTPGNTIIGKCEMQRGVDYFLNAVFATPQDPFGNSLCSETQCSTLIGSTRKPQN